jgi:hypothetical protein
MLRGGEQEGATPVVYEDKGDAGLGVNAVAMAWTASHPHLFFAFSSPERMGPRRWPWEQQEACQVLDGPTSFSSSPCVE